MSFLPSSVPTANFSTTEGQAASLSKLQSEESSYRSICNDALKRVDEALKRDDLDSDVRNKLTPLFASIEEQKQNLIAIISNAREVEESTKTDDEQRQQTQTLLDSFTETTGELSLQLGFLGKLIAEHNIPI